MAITCTCNDNEGKTARIREDMPDGFARIVQLTPAIRCPLPRDAPRSHGMGSVRMFFILLGPKGAVQWLIDTGWYLGQDGERLRWSKKPDGWDLGFHSPTPRYEDAEARECDLLPGGKCYFDGSGLRAVTLVEPFLAAPEGIWDVLLAEYEATLGGR